MTIYDMRQYSRSRFTVYCTLTSRQFWLQPRRHRRQVPKVVGGSRPRMVQFAELLELFTDDEKHAAFVLDTSAELSVQLQVTISRVD
jgi:hypothetical protein